MSDEYDILIELSADDVVKAADEREKRDAELIRLRAENEKLRAALKPFADRVDDFIPEKHDAHRALVTLGELRAAAAALKETGELCAKEALGGEEQ